MSSGTSGQYFADCLTDEITDSLARLKTMRVIARSSGLKFKGKSVDIHEVGRALNVESVLEGSVEQSGDRIRVVVHLERVSDGSHLWTNTYERRTADLFSLEPELAAGIAANLKTKAVSPPPNRVTNPEAYDSPLKARYDMQQMTSESLARAEAEYQHAIDLDPGYAAAYAGLAAAQYDRSGARGSTYQSAEDRKSVERLLRKALELDPGLTAARSLLASLAMQYDWIGPGPNRNSRPLPPCLRTRARRACTRAFWCSEGGFAEADQHLQRLLDLDPFSTPTLNHVALARNLEGRFVQARETAQRIQLAYPKMPAPERMIALTYIEEGNPAVALPLVRNLEGRFPPAAVFAAMAKGKAGQRKQALRLMEPFERKYPDSGIPMQWFALVYAFLNDEPTTLKWLERSADRHEWQALNLGVHPAYAGMRNSPRFHALKKRMGLE